MIAHPERIVVGISGASGAIYGVRLIKSLRKMGIETHLVITSAGKRTLIHETNLSAKDLIGLVDFNYDPRDIGAAISSGSFRTRGMVIVPCSIKSLSEIATGVTPGLLSRAADVTLKERRPLVLAVRETPLHLGHLESMAQVCRMGGIIMPPVPAFYTRPSNIDDLVDHTVGRILDLIGIDTGLVKRWGEATESKEFHRL